MHMMVAIEKLKNDGVSSKLPVPACDHETGISFYREIHNYLEYFRYLC